MTDWEGTNGQLDPRHGWHARPGCKIFVADRGAVRFDYPREWVVRSAADSVTFHDREPPDDESVLTVSYMRLPRVDWTGLPVATLLEAAMRDDERPLESCGSIRAVRRPDLELAWREASFHDLVANRDARSRTCIARGSTVQCLLTFDFWATDLSRCDETWDTVLETLRLGEVMANSRRGPLVS